MPRPLSLKIGLNMEQGESRREPQEETEASLSRLPFTYQRVFKPEEAQYIEWRVLPVQLEGQANLPRTDEEIIESVKRQHEAKQWFTSEYWRKKGKPVEQTEFTINGKPLTVYNFNSERSFSDEHIAQAVRALQELSKRFPQLLDKIRWVLIDNLQPPSLLGDDERYPTSGTAMKEHQAIRLTPYGMATSPHRIATASNFEGRLVHELGHLIQDEFEKDWRSKFQWAYCLDNKKEWEMRETPGGGKYWFNKLTGETSPTGQYPLQPDQCVTTYAKQNMAEDICDSLVAYLYDPERLKKVSPEKFAILYSHEVKPEKTPFISCQRIPKSQITLPEIKPKIISFFIEEPQE